MKLLRVFLNYLKWHYGKGILTAFSLWKNLTIFLFDYFSIRSLLGNFFTPWRRLTESYPRWYEFKDFFSSFVINTLMRIVGIIIRFFTIVFGSICIILFILSFPFALFIWIITPLLALTLVISGLILIIFG